jgi:hypothetical protein
LAGLGIANNKNLTEVATWAITNGTQEFTDVSILENIETRNPVFRYILPVLTVNMR